MALPTFAPPIGPSPGTSHKPEFKILDTEFGDGYSQPTPNGVNHMRRSVDLKWDALLEAQKDDIIDFFVHMQGTKAFYFQPYGERTARKWTCKDFSSSADEGVWKVQATFKQSFTNEA